MPQQSALQACSPCLVYFRFSQCTALTALLVTDVGSNCSLTCRHVHTHTVLCWVLQIRRGCCVRQVG